MTDEEMKRARAKYWGLSYIETENKPSRIYEFIHDGEWLMYAPSILLSIILIVAKVMDTK